jgi:hypothetical protein
MSGRACEHARMHALLKGHVNMQEILILSKCSIFLFHLDLWLSTIYLLKSLQQAKLEHSLLTQLLHERVNKLLSFFFLNFGR